MRLLIATRNPGKLAEFRHLLADLPITVMSVDQVAGAPDVVEDRETLKGNAETKACVLAEHTGLPTLADDTGLEVDALDGEPGVHSARYAGPAADPVANRRRLLAALEHHDNSAARFRTVLAFAEGGDCRFFEGVCEGRIIRTERGDGGFGYDPLFVPEGSDRTFAELAPDEKNAISHRGRALRLFAEYLHERLGGRVHAARPSSAP